MQLDCCLLLIGCRLIADGARGLGLRFSVKVSASFHSAVSATSFWMRSIFYASDADSDRYADALIGYARSGLPRSAAPLSEVVIAPGYIIAGPDDEVTRGRHASIALPLMR